jgi:hypothetical protein
MRPLAFRVGRAQQDCAPAFAAMIRGRMGRYRAVGGGGSFLQRRYFTVTAMSKLGT